MTRNTWLGWCPGQNECKAHVAPADANVPESVLLDYGKNTARACWGDLDDVFWWAQAREKDALKLSTKDLRQYVALLRGRKYSESTIRRRVTPFASSMTNSSLAE